MPCCVVCKNYTGSKKCTGISFHRFPKDDRRQHEWLIAVKSHLKQSRIIDKIGELNSKYICSDHFSPDCCFDNPRAKLIPHNLNRHPAKVLSEDAVPTIFGKSRDSSQCQPKKRTKKQLELIELLQSCMSGDQTPGPSSTPTSNLPIQTQTHTSQPTPVPIYTPTTQHTGPPRQPTQLYVRLPTPHTQTYVLSHPTTLDQAILQTTNQPEPAVLQPLDILGPTSSCTPDTTTPGPSFMLGTQPTEQDSAQKSQSLNSTFNAVPTLFSEDEISKQGPKYPELWPLKAKEPAHSGATGVQLSSVKETGKRKRSEDTPDAAVESLTPVYLHSQLSRWKGACNKLRLTDDQMAKFLLDRYYNEDKSSAFTDSQSTDKTLILVLDQGLVTLWNNSKADKGFSSDKDFLWFLLLGPQKSGTNIEGCTVRDHGASEECVPVKVDYVGPGYTASDTSQDSNDATNCPLIVQPATCKPSSLTQKKNITENVMIIQVPVTSQNNEMQIPRPKKNRKQVLEPRKDDPIFPESSGKEGSRCDHVISDDAAPTQQKVGGTENASASYTATERTLHVERVRKPGDTHLPNRAKSRKKVHLPPGPSEEPAKDLGNSGITTSCTAIAITETAMTTPVLVTSQNNEMQMPRHKKSRKQVLEPIKDDPVLPESFGKELQMPRCKKSRKQVLEPRQDNSVFPDSSGKEGSRCDHVVSDDAAPSPTQQKVGVTEKASMHVERVRNPSDQHLPNRAKRREYLVLGPRAEPAKDLHNFENSATCSKPTFGEIDIDLREKDELEMNDSDSTITASQLSSGAVGIRFKQEDDHNHSISSQQSCGSAVRIKVEKEDGLEVNLRNFENTNESCPQIGASGNIKEEDKVNYENTNTPQLSHNTISIKVEKEDGLEMDFGCYGNTNTSSHPSFDTNDIKEEELEMQLDSAIMATSKHLG